MTTPRQSVKQHVGGRRMMRIKEAMDSSVVRIAEGAAELYIPKPVEDMEALAAMEEARKLARSTTSMSFVEKRNRVYQERPKNKVKISTPLDSDAEEEEEDQTSSSSSDGSDSSHQLNEWERKQEEEAMQHWTLESAQDTFQELLKSFKFDQRVDTLEELQEGFSRRVESNQKLNSEMDALEDILREDWAQLEQEVAESKVYLEQHELTMFQALQKYFRCLDKYVSAPGSRQKALQELREMVRNSGGQVASMGQPSDVLEVVQTMVEEIKTLRQTLDLETKRHDAYEHALKKMSKAALIGDDSVMQDPVTAQVIREIRRWEIDGGVAEWGEEGAPLSKNEYAARVTKVKAEIEELRRRLERYNAKRQKKRRGSMTKNQQLALGEVVDEWKPAAFQNLSLFDDSVEWKFQRELAEISKAHKKLEGHLAKFEGLSSLIRYQEPDLEESLNRIMEMTSRATMLRLTRRIERLPPPLTSEEQSVENFVIIRQARGEEDEKEHRDNLKRLQAEKELMQKQADDQEQKQMQVQRAIRHEQRLQESLQSEIDEAKNMIDSLEDNVNLVVARETMRQAEDARSANAEKENELLEKTKAREQAEASAAKATELLEEAKALARKLLQQRAAELESDSEPSADELGDELGDGADSGRSSRASSRLSSSSKSSRVDSSRRISSALAGAFERIHRKAEDGDLEVGHMDSLGRSPEAGQGRAAAKKAADTAVMRARRQSATKGAAAIADIMSRAEPDGGGGGLGISNSFRSAASAAASSNASVGDTPPQSSQSIRTPKSGRRHSTMLNAFGMAARKGLSGQRASLLAVSGFIKTSDSQTDVQAEDSLESGGASPTSPAHAKSLRGGQPPDEAARRKDRRRTTVFTALSAAVKAQGRLRATGATVNAEEEDLDLNISNSMRSAAAGDTAASVGDTPPQSSQSTRTPKSGRRHSTMLLNAFGMAASKATGDTGKTELGRRMSAQRASLLAVSGFMKSSNDEDEVADDAESPAHSKSLRGGSGQASSGQAPEEPVRRKDLRRTTLVTALSAAAKAQARARATLNAGEEDLDLNISNSMRRVETGDTVTATVPDSPPQSSQSIRDTPPASSQSLRISKSGRRHSMLNAFSMAAKKAAGAEPGGRRLSGQRASLLAVSSFMRPSDAEAAEADVQAEDSEPPPHSKSLRGGTSPTSHPPDELVRHKGRRKTLSDSLSLGT